MASAKSSGSGKPGGANKSGGSGGFDGASNSGKSGGSGGGNNSGRSGKSGAPGGPGRSEAKGGRQGGARRQPNPPQAAAARARGGKPVFGAATKEGRILLGVTAAVVAAAAIFAVALALRGGAWGGGGNSAGGAAGAGGGSGDGAGAGTGALAAAVAVADQDLVIPIGDISPTASYYPVDIDGTRLEVLAVQAPDGSLRTAFNTCQVCYDSGRGYYKQDGSALVCQNCGNRFGMDQVEVASGGCNPVPIFPENKTVSDTSITISAEYLSEAKAIFANWKTEY